MLCEVMLFLSKGVVMMNFNGKKMVFLIIAIIAVMAVVTYLIFISIDRNQYIEEMNMILLGGEMINGN